MSDIDVKESILNSVKKMLGIAEDYTHFDPELIMYINGELMHLNQIGVGSGNVFTITDSTDTWEDFIGEDITQLPLIKPFIAGRVKLIFDPPQSSSAVQALNDQMKEYEWRLNVAVDPTPEENDAIKKEADARISKYYEDNEHVNIWKDTVNMPYGNGVGF